jgi:hypothetical protein
LEEWYGRTVINSNHRFTYEEAQEVIEWKDYNAMSNLCKKIGLVDFSVDEKVDEDLIKAHGLINAIKTLDKIAKKMRKVRLSKGSISFDKQEVRFKLDLEKYDVFCAHREEVSKGDLWFYPDTEYLDKHNYLASKHNIVWSDMAYNTSLLYFNDLNLAKEYADSALAFIRGVGEINPAFEKVAYILLAEQRFLYEYCRSKNLNVGVLIEGRYIPIGLKNGVAPFIDSNLEEVAERGFLHVWGFKNEMHKNKEIEDSFFGSLMSSRLSLRDDIVNSVSRNYELYESKYKLEK